MQQRNRGEGADSREGTGESRIEYKSRLVVVNEESSEQADECQEQRRCGQVVILQLVSPSGDEGKAEALR